MLENLKPAIKSIFTRNVFLIILFNLVFGASTQMSQVFLMPLGKELGLTASVLGMMTGLYTFFGMMMRSPSGALMDKGRYRVVLLWATLGGAVTFALMGFVQNGWLFFILRLLQAFILSFFNASVPAMLGLSVDRKILGTTFALMDIVSSLRTGPVKSFATSLYREKGFMAIALATAAVCVVSAVIAMMIDYDKLSSALATSNKPKKAKKSGGLKNMLAGVSLVVLPVCILFNLRVFATQTNTLYASVLCDEMAFDPTLAYNASGILNSVLGLIIGVTCDLFGARYITAFLLLLCGAGNIVIGTSTTSGMFAVGYCMATAGQKAMSALQIALVKAASPKSQGRVNSTRFFATDLISMISGPINGVIQGAFSTATLYVVTGAGPLLAAVIMFIFGKKLFDFSKLDEEEKEAEAA